MEIEKEVLETKAELRLSKHKMEALLNILTREGIVDPDDFEEEIKLLTKKK